MVGITAVAALCMVTLHDSDRGRAMVYAGGLLREYVREGDVVARLGGEEFAILLYDATLERAQAIAAEITNRIAATPLALADGRLYKDKARQKRAGRGSRSRGFKLVAPPREGACTFRSGFVWNLKHAARKRKPVSGQRHA